MIKFEHTLFALPFAFLGAVLAAEGFPTVVADSLDNGRNVRRSFGGDDV